MSRGPASSTRRATQVSYGQAIAELDTIRPDLAAIIHEHVTAVRAEAAWNRANAARTEREAATMRSRLPQPVTPPQGAIPDPFTIPAQEA